MLLLPVLAIWWISRTVFLHGSGHKDFYSSKPSSGRDFQSPCSHLPLPLEVDPPQLAGGVIRVQFPVLALGKIVQVNLN